jgi:hypothetical protein
MPFKMDLGIEWIPLKEPDAFIDLLISYKKMQKILPLFKVLITESHGILLKSLTLISLINVTDITQGGLIRLKDLLLMLMDLFLDLLPDNL